MSKYVRYLCGTPVAECKGSVGTGAWDGRKQHGTREEAFRCHRKWLLRTGHTQIGAREFKPDDGGPVKVLVKKSRFGGKLRKGKEIRTMPERGGGIVY